MQLSLQPINQIGEKTFLASQNRAYKKDCLANQEQSFYFSMSITINVIKTTTYSTTNLNDLSPALPDTTAK